MTKPIRLVAWNCQGGLARKLEPLRGLRPDVAVVSECANTVLAVDGLERVAWAGVHPAKGMAVFARPELGGSVDASHDPTREFFLPIRFTDVDFAMLAVWAMNFRGTEGRLGYGRTHLALEHYAEFLDSADLVVGDFNDNVRWDTPRRPHWDTTSRMLSNAGFANLHYEAGVTPGAEGFGTFFLYRHVGKPYVIDHVFVRRDQLSSVQAFAVGDPQTWLKLSDHVPLVLDIGSPAR